MAPGVAVSIVIPAPHEVVWEELARLERHVEWMADAHAIGFLGDLTTGVGTRMRVDTRFGPLRTQDVMEFTDWDPPRRMEVVHTGLFTGRGAFTLEPLGDRSTKVHWREEIRFPWYFGGRIGAWAARPVFRWVWRRNLRSFGDRFSAR
jgi:carbon monoxide dehydrogenase subunit G